jgi:hypothetical protein
MAVFPSSDADMKHLTKLTFSSGLQAWDNNYKEGQWIKKQITYLPVLLPELEIVEKAGGLQRVNIKQLRTLAKAVGLLILNKSATELRASLRDIWDKYLAYQE